MTTLALFRPLEKMEETADKAEALGYEVLKVPAMVVQAIDGPEWSRFTKGLQLGRWEWVILTSTLGVEIAVRRLRAAGLLETLATHKLVAIGEATQGALDAAGLGGAMVPRDTSSKGIAAALANFDLVGKGVAVLRSDRGNPILVETLKSLGAEVLDVALYHLGDAPETPGLKAFLQDPGQVEIFVFTSSLTVTNIVDAARAVGRLPILEAALARGCVAALGVPTRRALENAGIRVDMMPPRADLATMLRMIAERFPPAP